MIKQPAVTLVPAEPQPWQPEEGLSRRNLTLRRAAQEIQSRSGRVLEVGAGTARFLRALRAGRSDLQPHASDHDRASLLTARRMDPDVQLVQSDFTALPYHDESFDIALVFDVLEHLPEPERGLEELHRILTPGGLLHALVPCEGQPATLHWAMWKLRVASDLKERRVGHVQRFTHRSLSRLLHAHGFRIQRVSYSMHPIGQVRDVIRYIEEERWFPNWVQHNPLYRIARGAVWGAAYVESTVLRRIPLSAVALHVTAVKA